MQHPGFMPRFVARMSTKYYQCYCTRADCRVLQFPSFAPAPILHPEGAEIRAVRVCIDPEGTDEGTSKVDCRFISASLRPSSNCRIHIHWCGAPEGVEYRAVRGCIGPEGAGNPQARFICPVVPERAKARKSQVDCCIISRSSHNFRGKASRRPFV